MYVRDSRCEVRLESTGRRGGGGGGEGRMIMGREVKKNTRTVLMPDVPVSHFVCKQVMFKLILYARAAAVHIHC